MKTKPTKDKEPKERSARAVYKSMGMLQLRPKKRPRFTAVRGVVKQSKRVFKKQQAPQGMRKGRQEARKKEWHPKTEMMDEYKPKGPKAGKRFTKSIKSNANSSSSTKINFKKKIPVMSSNGMDASLEENNASGAETIKSLPKSSSSSKKTFKKRKDINDESLVENMSSNAKTIKSVPKSSNSTKKTSKKRKVISSYTSLAENMSSNAKTIKSVPDSLNSTKNTSKKRKVKSSYTSLEENPASGAEDTEDIVAVSMTLLNGDAEELDDTTEVEAVSGVDIGALCVSNSRQQGRKSFKWMIRPYSEEVFFSTYWEQRPLYIQRKNVDRKYFNGLFSTEDFDNILRKQRVLYTKNLDITSYSNGQRETHNPVGQAHPPVVWDYYNNGCSVRMLNPQTFHRPVWKLLYSLQEYFNCFCGANVYLTPPDTQGFAPHWDDIEAFILQLEGKKHWRVYQPRTEEELPVYSSKNLSQEELGKPVLEVTLSPGDVLYFPRGYIHQGQTVDGHHSLHITVSTYQRNTWGHYLEKLLPQALSAAMAEDVEFRRGLPRDYMDVMGIVNMDLESPGRQAFIKKVEELTMRLLKYAPLDATVDQRGSNLMHDALPPLLTPAEKERCARMGGEVWCPEKQEVVNRVELDPTTPVRLIRGNCMRVVAEGEGVNLYHCLENTREYHQEEPQFLELALEQAPAVEALVQAYPNYIAIENLPLADDTEKMNLASGLWERGLLMTAHIQDPAYDD
ncbi:hypothetical protein Pmani_031096 [Petrolisthes manimaculis]|uniref:Bifunctional lysine-specific demethylase and histidyl-hydroxylase n=1 Tax=Petrolisthes manimaculis TaxID=1843537 RepID=A0AAE1NVC1_9EUCA|nr:hypothetical protein Pmani_031096 [Petrolisthes manimaculis]